MSLLWDRNVGLLFYLLPLNLKPKIRKAKKKGKGRRGKVSVILFMINSTRDGEDTYIVKKTLKGL